MPEDVVGQAVWNRNQTILDKYGITVKGYLTDTYNSAAETALGAGEDLYDLMLISPERFHPLAMQGYMLDLYSLDYINTDHDAWMDYPNEQLSMGGRLYYTTNKFLLQDKNRCWGMFYNRDLARELNLGHFEDLVFDGEWTIDKVLEYGKIATYDSDGQPGLTKEDNWGAGASEHYMFCQLAFGSGFRFTEKGADGYPTLIGATDIMMKRLDKVYSLTANRDVYYCDQNFGTVDWTDCADQMFHRGKILTIAVVMSELQTVGGKIDFEMGVLPNPKYDTNQEEYYSIPNLGNGSLLGVPATVVDTAFAGYALEAISEESADTTYTAFIETNCMLQKAYDEDAAKCLDIIYNGIAYDIAFVSDIGALGTMMWKTLAGSTSNLYARLFTRYQTVAEKQISDIRETYAGLVQ